ncbi:FKBP-type peptidyl-prolyl cis-trans isomerase [Archangium gephyra]|uniref:FKBP-type peptidyl-prolyl cis-trans isomerase n=1 Tax=Archangium gephyra TaxID=48 RepID=UPI0035D50C3C
MNSRMSWAGAAVMLFTLGGCASQQAAQKLPAEVPAKAEAPSQGPAVAVEAPQTEDEKKFYALGLAVGRQLQTFDMTPEELEYVKAGLTAHLTGKEPAVDLQVYGPQLADLARTRATAGAEKEKEKARVYLEAAAKEPGAERTESGLIYTSITQGTGAQPGPTDAVTVNYRGMLTDGKEFDSSFKRGEPTDFPLSGVIKCWTEGVQKMRVGGRARLVCPSDLAYGDRGTPVIPGGAALVFEVELLDVKPAQPTE